MTEPRKFRKKPVVIEAVQYDGTEESADAICKWAAPAQYIGFVRKYLCIKTLEGDLTVSEGDYVIKGIKGEFYPCKPDIFEATYEEVR